MAEETKEIKIETNTQSQLPSLKNGVWLASVKQETINMNWFKHCGFGKINAARTTLLAIQAYTMVNNKLPSFVCCYGWAYNGGSQTGLHEITKVVESDMMIDNLYDTPFDDVPGVLGDPKGMACATMDKVTDTFIADCSDHTAYAVAKICAEMKIQFRCYKYLSPNRPYTQDLDADHYRQILNKAWVEDCKQGAEAMRKMCESKFGDVPNAT
jgi:hypothetical protein